MKYYYILVFSVCSPLGDMEVLERFRCFRPMGSLASWALRAETPGESDTHPVIELIRPQHGHQGAHDFTWEPLWALTVTENFFSGCEWESHISHIVKETIKKLETNLISLL